MAIITRFGLAIEITGDCGEHEVPGYPCPIRIARAVRADDGAERYYGDHNLRADGGAVEINQTLDAAPKVTLTPDQIRALPI